MADRVGQQLGSYRLVRLLGQGGFAEVYLGQHLHLNTQAAIKVLETRLSDYEIERFRAEAQTIAGLRHPNIVRMLDFGIERGTPFLIMEYASNGNLRQRHPPGTRVPLATILPYVKQIASALQYAHDARLIHRDIKPENMLLGTQQEVWLSDFGIAVEAQSTRQQQTGEFAGTAAYAAPEQLQGKPRPASDQYALGIVIYEWLSGDRPFHGSSLDIASQHVMMPPPPLRERVPTLAPAVEQVILTALAKDPRQRYASVAAFADALEQASRPTATWMGAATFITPQPPSPRPSTPTPTPPYASTPTPPGYGQPPQQAFGVPPPLAPTVQQFTPPASNYGAPAQGYGAPPAFGSAPTPGYGSWPQYAPQPGYPGIAVAPPPKKKKPIYGCLVVSLVIILLLVVGVLFFTAFIGGRKLSTPTPTPRRSIPTPPRKIPTIPEVSISEGAVVGQVAGYTIVLRVAGDGLAPLAIVYRA